MSLATSWWRIWQPVSWWIVWATHTWPISIKLVHVWWGGGRRASELQWITVCIVLHRPKNSLHVTVKFSGRLLHLYGCIVWESNTRTPKRGSFGLNLSIPQEIPVLVHSDSLKILAFENSLPFGISNKPSFIFSGTTH